MIIGTAGHIDHGKTALIGALTGVDTDRLKEEKARGISIDLGFAYLPTEAGILGFIDVPGHERFIHTMLAGASGIDFALLVVAADDGVMPQTREHLAILDLLGVSRGLVALTKADLADDARRAALTSEIAEVLKGTALDGAPVLAVSAQTGEGIAELRAALIEAAASFSAERRHADFGARFRLSVDRSFALSGAGTVVTGTVVSGAVAVGDRVTVSPTGLPARVRSIHAQNRPTERGVTGDRCALNLAGDSITAQAIARGDVVLDPLLHAPTDRIDASLRVLGSEPKPLGTWFPARLHHGAVEVGARVVPLEAEALAPGAEGLVQLVLERPIAAAVRDRFVLRDTSAQRTIGGGRFIDLRAPARKRRTPERLALLAAGGVADPATALARLVELPPYYLDLDAFARDRALAVDAPAALAAELKLATLAAGGTTLALSAARWGALSAEIGAALAAYHAANPDLAGIGVEKLRMELGVRLPKPAFLVALARLAAEGVLAVEGGWARLAGHEVRLTRGDELLWEAIAPMLAGPERFRPPRVRDIAGRLGEPEADIRRLFKLLSRLGKVDEVAHDHFFLRPVVSVMVGHARTLASDGEFSAAAFRDRIEHGEHAVGRKVAIQILEFFDRHGVTLRRGDLRRINRHRLDLFGAVDEPPAALLAALGGGEADVSASAREANGEESYLR